MSTGTTSDGVLTQWYRTRIGPPATDDEAVGYWVFALGVVLGVAGIALLITDDLTGPVPQWPVVLGAVGLALLVAGPIIRLPLRRGATWLVALGVLLCLAAIPWFVSAYPGWRPQATPIIGLYSLGLALMAVGGVFVPIIAGRAEREERLSELESELAELRAVLDDAEADESDLAARVRDLRRELADTAADEADLAERLRSLEDSQARFELYEDSGGEWRWRLRHRNGNTVADSGQGYTRRHNAQKGMQSVRRNALGATVLLLESEADLPEEDETFEPPEEIESRATFETYADSEGKHRWRLRHDNGNIVADSGEGYATASGMRTAVERIRQYAGPADYLRFDPTGFEVYRDAADEWRWRLVHRNGNILADGGEGYTRRNDARRAIERIRDGIDDLEFEVYEDSAGEYRWRLHGRSGGILADSGEGYTRQSDAEDAVERVREYAPDAHLLDVGQAAFEIFEDSGGEHRWRLRHRNGNVLADSGQGYADRGGARDGIESVKRNAANAETEPVES